ncbi:MAG: SpoIIE family protein phosphatase [Lachnospiraceae bacterium]|nr:SpoIIE family protein phosphatase [Lachnospiraceae bacterium]
MKRIRTKEMILYVLGVLLCKVGIADCYPFITAYFTILYLEMDRKIMAFVTCYIGMVIFLPVTQLGKYSVAVASIAIVIALIEWVDKNCRIQHAAITAGAMTTLVSLGGSLLSIKGGGYITSSILEGIVIYGIVVLGCRLVHMVVHGREIIEIAKENENFTKDQRLMTYAESFNGLSQAFARMNAATQRDSQEEWGQVQNEITGKICASCNMCGMCWEESSPVYNVFTSLIQSIEKFGKAEVEYEERLKDYCPYADDITKEAIRIFERMKANAAWYNRLLANREMIAQQLDAMAFIMEDCAKEYEDLSKKEKSMLAQIRFLARDRGFFITQMHLYRKQNGRLQLVTTVHAKAGCLPIKEYREAVSRGMGISMIQHKDSRNLIGTENCSIVFEENTKYHAIHGVARLTKDGAAISGDNFSFLELENGQMVMSLSDGMGSGIEACKESETVIELIEKFLEAGFSKETAIRMMNSAMVIRGEDDVFSTIDMASVDLYDGMAEFYKVGASATFIKKEEGVECLLSTSLPVGVSHKMELDGIKKQLRDGNFLVMVSDGVLEYLHVPEAEETMGEIIRSIDTNNPEKLAKGILEKVLLFTGGKVMDDMTVLTAGIWEK